MEDIEKELGPLLDEHKKLEEEMIEKGHKAAEEYRIKEHEYKELLDTIVHPVIIDFAKFIESKQVGSLGFRIERDKHFPVITFRLEQKGKFIEIKFSIEDEKVKITEKMNGKPEERVYDKSEISRNFVSKKLMDLIKPFLKIDSVRGN